VLVGDVELLPLVDALGELGDLGELYPEVEHAAWDPYRALYPQLFAGTQWRLPCTCYLLRTAGPTILVDTGVGPPGLWSWAQRSEGGLPTALDDQRVGREDVDIVFLTHLHIDHLGWNTDENGAVFFPRACYVVHRDALAFARTRPELPHIRRCVEPLVDRFEHVAGDVELAPSVTAVPAPGHYPGHMTVRIASAGAQALLLADVAVHPALLDHSEWRYVSDVDHEASVLTRTAHVEELVDTDVLAVCGHYPQGGIGRIVRKNGRVVWETA
jgi:glyoxylase-like metal-dependent hydrolase (beta-lactamase superfamily II)